MPNTEHRALFGGKRNKKKKKKKKENYEKKCGRTVAINENL